jgi:hypothetical protein
MLPGAASFGGNAARKGRRISAPGRGTITEAAKRRRPRFGREGRAERCASPDQRLLGDGRCDEVAVGGRRKLHLPPRRARDPEVLSANRHLASTVNGVRDAARGPEEERSDRSVAPAELHRPDQRRQAPALRRSKALAKRTHITAPDASTRVMV